MKITDPLIEYSLDCSFEDLPSKVIEKVKQHLLDCLGVATRASREVESSKPILDGIKLLSKNGGDCMVIGSEVSCLPQYAALINGTFIHSLDFDDTHRQSSVHPGASVVATLLALGENHNTGGKEFISAMTVGYDVACKLGKALNPSSHYQLGFHPTATVGVFAATAAGARLLGLTKAELGYAFGINGSQAAGSMQYLENGSWNKKLHPGFAAHNAILSLALSKNGVIGAALPLEGKNGFFNSYSRNSQPAKAIQGLGKKFEILATAIKPYPCCRYAHGPIDLIIKIVNSINIEPKDIEEIQVETVEKGVEIIGTPIQSKQNPHNIVDAQFSMPFNAAIAALHRRVTLDEYTLQNLSKSRVKKLMKKVFVETAPELEEEYPEKWGSRVTINAKGEEYVMESSYPKGEPENPLSWEEVISKFKSLTKPILSKKIRHQLIERVKTLEEISNIGQICNFLS